MRACRFSHSVLRTLTASRRPATNTQHLQATAAAQKSLPAPTRRSFHSPLIVAMATASPNPSSSPSSPSLGRLDPASTVLFVCDVQERFRPLIAGFDAVAETSSRLVRGARALGLPAVVVTEQYPKALGPTVDEVASVLNNDPPSTSASSTSTSAKTKTTVVAKTDFSMLVPEVQQALPAGTKSVILCGIEAHVCVWQTTLDLRERNVDVHLAVDGISSQRLLDRELGLARAAQAGAFLCSSEMLLFQLTGGTSNPAFKAVSALAKEESTGGDDQGRDRRVGGGFRGGDQGRGKRSERSICF